MEELKTLTPNEVRAIVEEFKREISDIVGDKLVEVVLYGSYARGDYECGSDIDVLVIVTERLTEDEKEQLSDIATALSLEYDTLISYFEYYYENFLRDETPFLMNVRKEGVKI